MLDINKPEPTDIKNHSLPPTDFNPYPSTLTTQSNYTTKPTTLDSGLEIGLETGLMGYNCLTYALYAISFFTAGLLAIVPLVMNYIKRDQARGTWLESHFDWQIKTYGFRKGRHFKSAVTTHRQGRCWLRSGVRRRGHLLPFGSTARHHYQYGR